MLRRMSAVQSGARGPGLTAVHSQPAQSRNSMEKARVLPRSGQILPQALPLRAAVKLPLLHWRRRAYRSFPSRSPASGDFPRVLYLLCFNYFFFFEAFLAFLFLAITGLHQRLKEAKHEARPYCDGLFDFRNEPRRTESFRLSTSGASGLEEKFVFNMLQSAKNISGGLHIIRKAARAI